MKTYSLDLREWIVAALQEGASVREVALRFGVSHDSVQRYQRRHEQGQSLLPFPGWDVHHVYHPKTRSFHHPVTREPQRDLSPDGCAVARAHRGGTAPIHHA